MSDSFPQWLEQFNEAVSERRFEKILPLCQDDFAGLPTKENNMITSLFNYLMNSGQQLYTNVFEFIGNTGYASVQMTKDDEKTDQEIFFLLYIQGSEIKCFSATREASELKEYMKQAS